MNKISLKKRGQAQYLLENAFRIGFLMIALLIFFLLINFYIVNKIDTNRLQAEVTANRIMYSDTFMYTNFDNSRTYIGIVDMEKFDSTIITDKINYPTKRHATAELTLIDNVNGIVNKTVYLNKEQYDNLYVIWKSKGEGKGSSTMYKKDYPVTYYDGHEYRYGTIVMRLLIPNS